MISGGAPVVGYLVPADSMPMQYGPPPGYRLSGSPTTHSDRYAGNAYMPVRGINVQPMPITVPAVSPQAASAYPSSNGAVPDTSGAYSKPAGSYVLLPAPQWTAMPTAVHSAPTQSLPILVHPASKGASDHARGTNAGQPTPPGITPDSSSSTPGVQSASYSAASSGGFSYPRVTPMSTPEPQSFSDYGGDSSGLSPAEAEARRLHIIRQTLRNDLIRNNIRVREPRPRQEKCACPDNGCLLGRERSLSSTRNHYSCKTATKMLMDWIDEHQDHPYPDREEKKRLATQACMTVKQLADWFGNARRRRRRQQQDEIHLTGREREMRVSSLERD